MLVITNTSINTLLQWSFIFTTSPSPVVSVINHGKSNIIFLPTTAARVKPYFQVRRLSKKRRSISLYNIPVTPSLQLTHPFIYFFTSLFSSYHLMFIIFLLYYYYYDCYYCLRRKVPFCEFFVYLLGTNIRFTPLKKVFIIVLLFSFCHLSAIPLT